MESELIGEVRLRNCHLVYREGSNYRVDVIKAQRPTIVFTKNITCEVVEYLYNQLKGHQVNKDEAADVLKPVASKLNLPYSYGHQLAYYTQEVLVVLVAIGRASLSQQIGRGCCYTIFRTC
ncbi:hypothetical protein [Microcoleus sp. D2_18a_B4]|uniref:hypothetical protein n=1 Tax=Microcoleus sp. D2_18a_B4 TaxID=3055329 RepID=UPI002FD190EC